MGQVSNEELAQMLLDALDADGPEADARARGRRGRAVRGHGARPSGRRRVLPLPHAAAARRRRPRRQDDGAGARSDQADRRGRVRRAARARRLRRPAQGPEGDDRGRDPPAARRRPRRRGDGAHAAQAVARRRRLHARVARGDAAAPEGDLPAHARARGPARAAPPAPPSRHARLPPTVRHSLSYGGVPAEPKFKRPAPVEARDHGGRRHLRFGRLVRPVHAAVRVRDAERVLEGALVGVHRRRRRGHPLLRRVRRARRPRSTGSTPKPTSCGSTATPTTATRSRCGTSATSAR